MSLVAHCNPMTQEAEAGELPHIQVQIGLHNDLNGILNFIARLCHFWKTNPTKVIKGNMTYTWA